MTATLDGLLADGVIDAVIGQLKTGKEAEVWLVEHQGEIVAAKLYKERHARNFRNNAGYREGREVRSSRTARAMTKGSKFGLAAAEEAWRSAEVDALYILHAAGVRVPTPVLFYEGILLMELVIDASGHPAPRLVEAGPTSHEEAEALYEDLRNQTVRMLAADLVHGDLSAYNILSAWNGPVIIDFPQAVFAAKNNMAERYFRRDLDNVRNFFASYAPSLHARAWETDDIWNAYVKRELSPEYVPNPRNRRDTPRGAPGVRPGRGPVAPAPRGAGGRLPSVPTAASHFDRSAFVREEAPVEPVMAAGQDGITDEEAELRALEASLLRQGGGERGKPPGASRDDQQAQRGRGGNRGPRRGPGGPNAPGRSGSAGGPRGPGGPQGTGNQGPRGPRPQGAGGQAARGPGPQQGAGGQESRGPRPQNAAGQGPRGPRPQQAAGAQESRGPRAPQGAAGQESRGPRAPQGAGAQESRGPRAPQGAGAQESRGPRAPQGAGGQGPRGPKPQQGAARGPIVQQLVRGPASQPGQAGPRIESRPPLPGAGGGRPPDRGASNRGPGFERGAGNRNGPREPRGPNPGEARGPRRAPGAGGGGPAVSFVRRSPGDGENS